MSTDTDERPRTGASGLSQAGWIDRLARIGRDHGAFQRLGSGHLALFVQEGDTLVVSFDRAARVHAEEPDGLPQGFEAVQKREWSLLSILALDDPWFRSPDLVAFFDRLAAEGFFDSFEQVIFLGFGPACGHAACAYSSAAPGAQVLAVSPAAALDASRIARATGAGAAPAGDLTRYGDAARLVAAAREAVILFDPAEPAAAAHAGRFHADHVRLVPLRFTGLSPERLIAAGGLLMPLLRALAHGRLTGEKVARMIRPVRRADPAYLWHLATIALAQGRPVRARRVADYAADVTGEARFAALAERLSPGAGGS